MPRRIYEGTFSVGEFHWHSNTLSGVGAETELHAHKYDHVALFSPGKTGRERYEVYAEGERVGTKEFGGMEFALIKKGVRHRIKLIEGEEGYFTCMFSRYGANGELRANPDG